MSAAVLSPLCPYPPDNRGVCRQTGCLVMTRFAFLCDVFGEHLGDGDQSEAFLLLASEYCWMMVLCSEFVCSSGIGDCFSSNGWFQWWTVSMFSDKSQTSQNARLYCVEANSEIKNSTVIIIIVKMEWFVHIYILYKEMSRNFKKLKKKLPEV